MTSEKKLSAKTFKIKLFASAREMVDGKSEIVLEFKQKPIESTDLKERILQLYPQLKRIPFVLAVNYKIVIDKPSTEIRSNKTSGMSTTTITGDDEIALLPPISGG
ncbi:MAG TPA: MoaD/ThiS family protein [Nitrososphaeraceae archaeon]|nr:MoaD/ThiS family protein [Nitrososphaeraceae archaeon]